MFFIREHSKKLRITLVANVIFSFTLLTNSYVYNLMESQAIIENDWTSHYEVNAHNGGPVSQKYHFFSSLQKITKLTFMFRDGM